MEWSEPQQKYVENPELGIIVEVQVRRHASLRIHPPYSCLTIMQEEPSGHVVVKTTGPSDGVFTFTSHEAGDHSICLSTNHTSWFSHTHIRLYIDIVVGSTKPNVEHDRSHVSELASKLRDLNQKLEDIRREQQYQREREADYRDLSEATNARAVWYSIAQIIVLLVTCAWQLRHLKVCHFHARFYSCLLNFSSASSRTGKCDDTVSILLAFNVLSQPRGLIAFVSALILEPEEDLLAIPTRRESSEHLSDLPCCFVVIVLLAD